MKVYVVLVSYYDNDYEIEKTLINSIRAYFSMLDIAAIYNVKMDTIALRNAVNQLSEIYSGYCAIFSGNEETGYQFIVGSNQKDCNELAKNFRTAFGAKCGGNNTMIQGSITADKNHILTQFT